MRVAERGKGERERELVCVSSDSGRIFAETPQMMRHYLL